MSFIDISPHEWRYHFLNGGVPNRRVHNLKSWRAILHISANVLNALCFKWKFTKCRAKLYLGNDNTLFCFKRSTSSTPQVYNGSNSIATRPRVRSVVLWSIDQLIEMTVGLSEFRRTIQMIFRLKLGDVVNYMSRAVSCILVSKRMVKSWDREHKIVIAVCTADDESCRHIRYVVSASE